MTSVVARLSDEDLTRWRLAQARLHGIDKKPEGYSPSEVEQAYIASARLMGEFCERYSVDDSRNWIVSCYTGLIYYQE